MLSPRTILRMRQRQARRKNAFWLRLLAVALAVLVALAGTATAAGGAALVTGYQYFAQDLPSPEQFENMAQTSFETSKIYDRTGQHLLAEAVDPEGEDRTKIPFSEIPAHLRNATVALEDKTFYTNPGGINIEGLGRALWNNLSGQSVQGGSSIAAQVVRNIAMDPEERFAISYERKIKEVILSYELTRRFPGMEGRDRILEWYLNTVYYGNHANGVEAAAKVYFSKHAKDLTLAECALLATVPQYPAMNPIDNPEEAKARQGLALDAMLAQGYITEAEAEEARNAELGPPAPPPETPNFEAPHFVQYLLKQLEERYGKNKVYGGGLRVITTLDYDLQKQAEKIVSEQVTKASGDNKIPYNAATVAIRPNTGEVLAMVGSADYNNPDPIFAGKVNMAEAPRQPGSSIKPFTYAAAFEQGYAPANIFYDVRTVFEQKNGLPYSPPNFDLKYHGPMPLRRALACSYNIPAVDLLDRIGIDSLLEMAHRLGITTLRDHYDLALGLGGAGGVRLIDHTYAFSVFANGGVMAGASVPPERREQGYRELDPVLVLKVTDSQGNVLDEFKSPAFKEVLNPQAAYMISNVLSDNAARAPAFGVNSALVLSRPAAAKTGTTNEYKDAWTMGYTPQLAVGVWMGNADTRPMDAVSGTRGAAPIWHDIMEYALKDQPVVDFVEPPGMKWVEVDAESGNLPGPYTRSRFKEIFIDGREPKKTDTLHKEISVCRASGKLATSYCPPDQLDTQIYPLYPAEVLDWQRANQQPIPPTSYCDQHGPNLRASDASITWPGIFQAVGGAAQVTGNARIPGFREYLLEYGPGLEPGEWYPIGGTHGNSVDNQVLENWDTMGLNNGLYTLRLTVRGDQDRQVSVPVTVDNTKPQIRTTMPLNNDTFIKEQADIAQWEVEATDNMAIDRVEFWVDGQIVGESRVGPYGFTWPLAMNGADPSIIPPVPEMGLGEITGEENGQPLLWRKAQEGEATIFTKEVGSGDTISRTTVIRDSQSTTVILPNGWGASWTKEDYREVHTLQAIAYDAAGNQEKAAPVLIYVMHKKAEPAQPAG